MKLVILQMFLGVLIVLAACYIVGWMIFEVPHLLKMLLPDDSGALEYVDVVASNGVLFTVVRFASALVLGLGMVVLVAGVAQLTRAGEKIRKLAVVQIVSGSLIAVISFLIVIWGYPTQFDVPMPEGSEIKRTIFINPGSERMRVELVAALASVLGLAVSGCDIARYLKTGQRG